MIQSQYVAIMNTVQKNRREDKIMGFDAEITVYEVNDDNEFINEIHYIYLRKQYNIAHRIRQLEHEALKLKPADKSCNYRRTGYEITLSQLIIMEQECRQILDFDAKWRSVYTTPDYIENIKEFHKNLNELIAIYDKAHEDGKNIIIFYTDDELIW